jgi:hypothetical protein
MTYQAIANAGRRGRLVYDAERIRLYAANRTTQLIERYAFSSGTWSALTSVSAVAAQDVDLAPGGKSLVVATSGILGDLDLDAATPSVVQRATNPDPFCGGYFAQVAAANSGKVLVVFKLAQCSGFHSSYLYDLQDHSLKTSTMLYEGLAGVGADGSRIFTGSNGVSPAQPVYVYDALAASSTSSSALYNLTDVSVSGDASRVVLQRTDVYTRALVLTGHLPANGGALAARDATKAFVYRDDGTAGARLEVYDLTATPGTGALYPLLTTVSLADLPNTSTGLTVQLVGTPDDGAVFVSGNKNLLVVPVK